MKKVKLFQLMDLVEEIKKVEDLITTSRKTRTSALLIKQYETRKNQVMGSLINELTSPELQSTQSYLLIKMLLEKYYAATDGVDEISDVDIAKLAKAV